MKKLLLLFSLFLYLISASGIKINVHYCGGKLKQISFFDIKEKQGCCGNKIRSKGCCKNKTAFVKITDLHKSSVDLKLTEPYCQLTDQLLPVLELFFSAPAASADVSFYYYSKPPDLSSPALYISNNTFLI